MGTILYVTAEIIRQVAILAQPFMPGSAAKLLDLLAVPDEERDFTLLGGGQRLAPGSTLPAARGGISALCRARSQRAEIA